jgi:glutaredoxin 3
VATVTIYTTRGCGYCSRAKRRLRRHGAVIDERPAGDDEAAARRMLRERFGVDTFPQIVIGDRHIGGASELAKLDRAGALAPLLAE